MQIHGIKLETNLAVSKGRPIALKDERRIIVHPDDIYKFVFMGKVDENAVNMAIAYAKGVIQKVIDKY